MKVKNTYASGSSSDGNFCFLGSSATSSCGAGEALLLSLGDVLAHKTIPHQRSGLRPEMNLGNSHSVWMGFTFKLMEWMHFFI